SGPSRPANSMAIAKAPRSLRNFAPARSFSPRVEPTNGQRLMPTASGHTTAIRATRAVGTDIYNLDGKKIGKIEDLVLDKTDNAIMFAVAGFGGFLGIGEKYHALPWASLDYSADTGGYVVP